MAFVVEDGTGLSNSTSYASVAFFRAFNTDRGRDTMASSDSVVQAALVVASDFLDGKYDFVGFRSLASQAMQWPRVDAYYFDGEPAQLVPDEVAEAVSELAYYHLTTPIAPNPSYGTTGGVIKRKREKVGPIEEETEYRDAPPLAFKDYPFAEQRLRELIRSGNELLRA
jgi:hypothetical protein